MTKFTLVLFAGIFVGAVAYELLCRLNPELIQKGEDMADNLFKTAKLNEQA